MRRIILPLVLVGVLAGILAPSAAALRFTDDSFFTPVGIVGQSYSHQFNGAAGCGPALPYQYRLLNGELPPGLTMSKAGKITGTPTHAGDFSFWVELSDEDPPSQSWCLVQKAERSFSIRIEPALSVEQQSLSAIMASKPYSFKLTASGGGLQTWSVLSGALAPGIALAPDGTLSGTPTQVGDFQFVVKVTDGTRTDTETLVLRVVQELKAVAPATAPPAEVGIALKPLTFTATGGTAPYKWAAAQGTPLPTGFTLDQATGALTGTPTATGPLQITVAVTDASGFLANVQIALDVKAKLAITTKRLTTTTVGKEYKAQILTSGGVLPARLKIASGKFPLGIHLDRTLGALVGKARVAGTYTITVEATDSLGAVATQTLVLNVRAKLAIATKRLATATVGKAYRAKILTSGGVPPLKRLKIVSGKLPVGVRFDRTLGALVGSPRVAGTFTITVEAVDSLGSVATQTLVLKVLPKKT
jgi:large repetitive protein